MSSSPTPIPAGSGHPPPAPEPPLFVADGIESDDDCTFFIHDPTPVNSAPAPNGTGAFDPWCTFLGETRNPSTGEPYLALARELIFTVPGGTGPHSARGLACFSARRRAVSVTIRSIKPKPNFTHGGWPDRHQTAITSSYRPEPDRTKGGGNWFALSEQCHILSGCLFPGLAAWLDNRTPPAGTPGNGVGKEHGLVLITGATNSAKSKIARGLIFNYLQGLVDDQRTRQAAGHKPGRRPHLVTFEDPIEDFYADPGTPPGPTVPLNRAQLARDGFGIDYTPRQRGLDVRDLHQGFQDALRQTPAVFFIGEVRDLADWRDVLDFAGTGHLVVTTAHAGSLTEAMIKLLGAVEAKTPADRRRWAEKILAVIHLRPVPALEAGGRNLLLPAVWRRSDAGLTDLVAAGLGAVVPRYPDPKTQAPGLLLPQNCSPVGRRWFLEQLLARARTNMNGDSSFLDAAHKKEPTLVNKTIELDLRGA